MEPYSVGIPISVARVLGKTGQLLIGAVILVDCLVTSIVLSGLMAYHPD